MNISRYLLVAVALIASILTMSAAQSAAKDGTSTAPENLPECKVALRMITSPDYLHDHHGEIPDDQKMSNDEKAAFVADLFRKSISDLDKPEDFCVNTIHDNLRYTNTYNLPQQCVDFIPLLQKSFEDKVEFKKGQDQVVQQKMDESITDMLVQDQLAPAQLVKRCEVGIKVMQVDLSDRHLKEKYPLPVACEALFAEMEKSMILPSQLETIRRQRVLFVLENKGDPKQLDAICDEITK